MVDLTASIEAVPGQCRQIRVERHARGMLRVLTRP